MALKEGTPAPDFTASSSNGDTFTLSEDAQGKAVILYFYPKDFTPGCTAEACEFRDSFSFFKNMDVPVFGISRDDLETHRRFKEKYELPFALLSDPDGSIAQKYQAKAAFLGMTRRITYLLDENHTIIASYTNLFQARQHILQMKKRLQQRVN